MQNLPEEVIHKINDFRIGDHEYWKNQYNKVMNELVYVPICRYCNRRCRDFPDGVILVDKLCKICSNDYTDGHFWCGNDGVKVYWGLSFYSVV